MGLNFMVNHSRCVYIFAILNFMTDLSYTVLLNSGGFFLDSNTGMISAATHPSYSQILPLSFSVTYTSARQALALPLHVFRNPDDLNIFQYFSTNNINFLTTISYVPTGKSLRAINALPISLGSVMYLESNPDHNDATSRPLKIGQFINAEYDPVQSWDHFKLGTLMDNRWTRHCMFIIIISES